MQPFDRATLLQMLTYCRPAGGYTEAQFIARYIQPLPGAIMDQHKNWHVIIGESSILWSCHTDTVHHIDGRQTVHFDKAANTVELSKRAKTFSNCLGADDTAGVHVLRQMILSGIPGHYIFHYAEERGAPGSSNLASHDPQRLDGIKCAIALDRRGTSDVITHQCGRCCSDAFAESLADALNVSGLTYQPSEYGIFTDTANYTEIVPECTNLSVGYQNEHRDAEILDIGHLERLYHALCVLDPATLVIERDPHVVEVDTEHWDYRDYGSLVFDHEPTPLLSLVHQSLDGWCQYCGLDYDLDCSTADDYERYCSSSCQDASCHRGALPAARSIYLDPVFDAVQAALRRRVH